jgi:hypothetical protein
VFDNGVFRNVDPSGLLLAEEQVAVADMACVSCPTARVSYLIVHPEGTLLWDSGVVRDSEIEAGFRGSRTGKEGLPRGRTKRGTIKAAKP